MLFYQEHNANPKKHKTSDCLTRALSVALCKRYDEILLLQYEEAKKSYYGITSKQVMERVLKRMGFIKQKQPRKPDGKKYTVGELDKILPYEVRWYGVLVSIPEHAVAILGSTVYDTWDCRDKTVLNYYISVHSLTESQANEMRRKGLIG